MICNYLCCLLRRNGLIMPIFNSFLLGCLFFLLSCGSSLKTVEIHSHSPTTKIYIEDKFIGLTPIKTNLHVGIYPIKASKSNFFSYFSNCQITSNQVIYFTLEKHTGSITIDYNYKPDSFFLNGFKTPISNNKSVPIGTIKIFAYKNGYPFIQKSLVVDRDKNRHLKINFIKTGMETELRIDSIPSKSQVLFDGKEIAETPINFKNLSAGTYKWELKREGYKSEFLNVSLKKRDKRMFTVNLTQDNVNLEIKPYIKAQVSVHRESNQLPILLADVDTNGFITKVPTGTYLIKCYPIDSSSGFVSMDKSLEMTVKVNEDTSVIFSTPNNKNKLDLVKVDLESEIELSQLLFIAADVASKRKKLYFIDAQKGVIDSKGDSYLPPVFMSDWNNCFIQNENKVRFLYISDSLNVFRGALSKKDDWEEVHQAQTGFINGIYPMGDSLLISSINGDWNLFNLNNQLSPSRQSGNVDNAKNIISMNELKKSIGNKKIIHKTFAYEEGVLYLLAQNSEGISTDIFSIYPATQSMNKIKIKTLTLSKINNVNQNYSFLQSQEHLYLWSSSSSSIHLYNKDGEFLDSYKLSLPGMVDSFIIKGKKLYFKTKNRVFCFKIEGNL